MEEMWHCLNLIKDEVSEILIKENKVIEGNKMGNLYLVGQVIAERNINKEIIHNMMKKIQRTSKSFFLQVLSLNLFLIRLEQKEDKNKLLQGWSWLFDVAYLFNLKPYGGCTLPMRIDFNKAAL